MREPTAPSSRGSASEPTTLVAAGVVASSAADGTIRPRSEHGVFFRDVRVVSTLAWSVDDRPLELLSGRRVDAATATLAAAVTGEATGTPIGVVLQRRCVTTAVVDELTVTATDGALGTLRLEVASDGVLLRKGFTAGPQRGPVPGAVEGEWSTVVDGAGVVVTADPAATLDDGRLVWQLDLSPRETATVSVRMTPTWRDETPAPVPSGLVATPRVVRGPRRLRAALASAGDDVAALATPAPDGGRFLAAGAPWFMALFGRDALLTAWMALPTGTRLALDVLETLADHQGVAHDARTLEQPGRILHELRVGALDPFDTGGRPYYGTVDATPLFVMLLEEAHRFGGDQGRIEALLPAARAAVRWCLEDGRGDGEFVTYRPDPAGLVNQSWKDSDDSMVHADGSVAEGPIAACEVQAYVHGALTGLADLEARLGAATAAEQLRDEAARLRERFRARFWLPDDGYVAMALDGTGRPLAVPSSNMGHCLWTGILGDDHADVVARRVVQADLLSPWGLRSLARSTRSYDPMSYHRGSVWPHDTAIVMAGLARAGHRAAAADLAARLLHAAEAFGWRLPELLGGFDDDLLDHPVPYPTACSPQAWSAAVPLVALRVLLGLEPDLPAGRLTLSPALADRLVVEDVVIGDRTVRITTAGDEAVVEGLDGSVAVARAA